LSVVSCPLSVEDLSVVRGPWSVVPDESEGEPAAAGELGPPGSAQGPDNALPPVPSNGLHPTADESSDAEPRSNDNGQRGSEVEEIAVERSDNGRRTTDHGQLRTEANTTTDDLLNDGPRTTDHGQIRSEANTAADELSDNGPRTTDNGPRTTTDWSED